MKKIKFHDDWVFWVDEEKTQAFYESREGQVAPTFKERLPQVMVFLEQMGIDAQKPLNPESMNSFDDLLYFAYGTAETTTGFELDFYEADTLMASIVVYQKLDGVESYLRELPERNTDILLLEIFVNISNDEKRM